MGTARAEEDLQVPLGFASRNVPAKRLRLQRELAEEVSGTGVHLLSVCVVLLGRIAFSRGEISGQDQHWHVQTVPSWGCFSGGCSEPRDA